MPRVLQHCTTLARTKIGSSKYIWRLTVRIKRKKPHLPQVHQPWVRKTTNMRLTQPKYLPITPNQTHLPNPTNLSPYHNYNPTYHLPMLLLLRKKYNPRLLLQPQIRLHRLLSFLLHPRCYAAFTPPTTPNRPLSIPTTWRLATLHVSPATHPPTPPHRLPQGPLPLLMLVHLLKCS